MDRRLVPANGRVALQELQGQVPAGQFVDGNWARVGVPVADMLAAPGGRRDRQLVYGERFLVLEQRDGFAFGQAGRDSYVGYVDAASLGADGAATHWVSALATHLYPAPDIKQPEALALTFGARLTIVATVDARFVQTDQRLYALRPHLQSIGESAGDPVDVALKFIGTPYLWGGNSRCGIDCSGLVQAAHLACGIACPGDSDLQSNGLGWALPDSEALRRGDVLFWKGHVAICVDKERLVHAVGYFMDVRVERIEAVVARNLELGAGPVVARRRVRG